jgi:uncharacterized membrane protein
MSSWKRDFASGLIVVLPVLVSAYVIAWLYGVISAVTPQRVIKTDLLTDLGLSAAVANALVEPLRVLVVLAVFVVFVFSVGYLMRTAVGNLAEGLIDNMANRVPGLRVVYNASKMAAETALGGTDSLQTPVRVEPWEGMRMTAFKTGKTTEDGREVVFLPTAPNITTGFVIELDPGDIEETDERVEDALTRILSAGFGDSERMGSSAVEDLVEGGEDDG